MFFVRRVATCAALAAVVALALTQLGPAQAAIVPPQTPSSNIFPAPGYVGPCGSVAQPNPYCPHGLTTLYGDRQAEGVSPMSLPSTWNTLTPPEQLFVLTNLERIDRGIPPIEGLAANLDASAQAGANAGSDPRFPPYGSGGGSTYASNSTLGVAMTQWVYDDGANSPNVDCPTIGAPGCWAHRQIILSRYAAPALMGVGYGHGTAQLFVGGDTVDTPYFTWSQVTPFLPVGAFPYGVNASALAGGSQASTFQLWASGESQDIHLAQSGGSGVFSLNTTECNLPAGATCTVTVNFTPPALGVYNATLVATGPNGSQNIPLRGVASHGYHTVASDGGVFSFGDAAFYGSMGGRPLAAPIVAMARTPDGKGYWQVASDGGVFSFGDATFYGSMGGKRLNAPIVALTPTPDGGGYWEVAADGGIFSYGDATFFGSRGGQSLNAPIVGMAVDATGHGYWEVAADGGIFSYGDAVFRGSAGSLPLVQSVVGMAATPDGGGYWEVAADGGVFNFGDARFQGSMGGAPLARPMVGIAATTDGGGYWLTASDGGVFNFGDAAFYGSMGGQALQAPMVGVAAG